MKSRTRERKKKAKSKKESEAGKFEKWVEKRGRHLAVMGRVIANLLSLSSLLARAKWEISASLQEKQTSKGGFFYIFFPKHPFFVIVRFFHSSVCNDGLNWPIDASSSLASFSAKVLSAFEPLCWFGKDGNDDSLTLVLLLV